MRFISSSVPWSGLPLHLCTSVQTTLGQDWISVH